jgi:uncharacterized protein involved in exopolysaccharide biosynthesis
MEKLTIKSNLPESRSPFVENVIMPILRYKKMTYIMVSSTFAVTLIICLLLKNQYTSTAAILPTGNTSITSELKDLAAGSLGDLGLGGASQSADNSSALYPSILSSRLLSEKLLDRNYSFYHKSKPYSMTLEEYIDAPNRDKTLQQLDKLVTVDVDRKTGVIKLSVTTDYPELSAAVVHAYLEELDDFNIHHRQSAASENVKFTARRLTEIRTELEQAEDSLTAFKESNMNFMVSNDPILQLELSRLQREVDIKSSLYLIMSQQNETAKVEAAKDTPVIQVLDPGAVPIDKTSPRRSLILLAAILGSAAFSMMLSIWLDVSIKRGLNRRLKEVVTSPEIKMNNIESRIAGRLGRFAELIEKIEK